MFKSAGNPLGLDLDARKRIRPAKLSLIVSASKGLHLRVQAWGVEVCGVVGAGHCGAVDVNRACVAGIGCCSAHGIGCCGAMDVGRSCKLHVKHSLRQLVYNSHFASR